MFPMQKNFIIDFLYKLKPEQYLTYTFKQIQQGNDVTRYVPWSEEIPDYCRLKNPKQK